MTHNIQQSTLFTHNKLNNPHKYPAGQIYQVVVNTEDESFEYEVEADSYTDACRQAEDMANSLSVDIMYIEIYNFE